jgi:pimeloyl-ACP methyl ester carboxylesterase
MAITSFDPSIPQSEVDRLYRKLKDTRLPKTEIVPGAGDEYGVPLAWVHKLYDYWLNEYDWTATQKRISSWNHYTTSIEDVKIHFVHQQAKKPAKKVVPLLLVHGWPGSWWEFNRVIDALAGSEKDDGIVFDVVVPSLPGYCWSEVEKHPKGWTLQDTARVLNKLMLELGYSEYVTSGGDWGHWVGHTCTTQGKILTI